jgi:membrane-associated phospholipid phosphatase
MPDPRARELQPVSPETEPNWKALYAATILVLAAVEAILLWRGAALTTPLVFLVLTVVFVRRRQKLAFVRDFLPFILVLFVYYSMWGSADDTGRAVQVTPQIRAEKALFFGKVPTIVLQNAFYDSNHAHWYDYAAVGLHLTHFVLPILFAAIIWQHYRWMHVQYMTAFVALSYAAYVTFVLMPSAPPWFASEMGALDTVYLVQRHVPFFQQIFDHASANPVAAWPSLHAAMPWLMFLFAVRLWGRRAVPVVVYPLLIWLNIVYLGHHYVVDAIGGAAYATVVFSAVVLAARVSRARPWRIVTPGSAETGVVGEDVSERARAA